VKEGYYDITYDVPIDIKNKRKDQEIESRKKGYQKQKLQLIKNEEEYQGIIARITKENMEEDKKKQEAQIVRGNQI
jgi:hypothetical protein